MGLLTIGTPLIVLRILKVRAPRHCQYHIRHSLPHLGTLCGRPTTTCHWSRNFPIVKRQGPCHPPSTRTWCSNSRRCRSKCQSWPHFHFETSRCWIGLGIGSEKR